MSRERQAVAAAFQFLTRLPVKAELDFSRICLNAVQVIIRWWEWSLASSSGALRRLLLWCCRRCRVRFLLWLSGFG